MARPRTVARQDRILAVLRDAGGFPLSTAGIAARLDEWVERRRYCECSRCGDVHPGRVYAYRLDAEGLRPTLKRMARDGMLELVEVGDGRTLYWRFSS